MALKSKTLLVSSNLATKYLKVTCLEVTCKQRELFIARSVKLRIRK
jgi:hypothetical protein